MFLGVKVVIDKHTEKVWIGQPTFSKTILFKFGMENSNEVTTPVDTSTKLMKADEHDSGRSRWVSGVRFERNPLLNLAQWKSKYINIVVLTILSYQTASYILLYFSRMHAAALDTIYIIYIKPSATLHFSSPTALKTIEIL